MSATFNINTVHNLYNAETMHIRVENARSNDDLAKELATIKQWLADTTQNQVPQSVEQEIDQIAEDVKTGNGNSQSFKDRLDGVAETIKAIDEGSTKLVEISKVVGALALKAFSLFA